jgi:excisionase family DNA binding protein
MVSTLLPPQPATAINPQGLVTVDDAASYLALGKTTVRQMLLDGTLHAVRLRRCVRIRWSELQTLAAQGDCA